MIIFLAGRASLLMVTLAVLIVFSYGLNFWFPLDPLVNLSGVVDNQASTLATLAEKYQLNSPIWTQLLTYSKLLLNGDWGLSIATQIPVFEQLMLKLPATLELVLYSTIISLAIGIPTGIISGIFRRSKLDYGVLSVSLIGSSIPVFWLALILVAIFSFDLGVLPTAGRIAVLFEVPQVTGFIFVDIYLSNINNKTAIYSDAFKHLILPTLSLAIVTLALIIRIVRRSTVDVMNSDYIKANQARGLAPSVTIMRHGIKNIIFPVIPILTLQFTVLLTNIMIVEVVFDWPGVGNWLLNALAQNDYPVIRAGLLFMASLVMLIIVGVDVLLRIVDPVKQRDIHGTI